MNRIKTSASSAAVLLALLGASGGAGAVPFTQCPGDIYMPEVINGMPTGNLVNGTDSVPDPFLRDLAAVGQPVIGPNPDYKPGVKCMHLAAGDGFVNMADGYLQYMFGFSDMTGTDSSQAMVNGLLAAHSPAPTIELEQGQEFYLNLTNVGMTNRPDLSDPHTVHFHGFPQAMDTFDGVPDTSISINMGSTLTYYYSIVEPGTYMYHCHVEATEHMQMGMLGNLYVHAAQDQSVAAQPVKDCAGATYNHVAGQRYAYNDCDGTTRYDVEFPLQLISFDSRFHDSSMNVQPLPFANMKDNYPMINGRGYPDTAATGPLPAGAAQVENGGIDSQVMNALVTATVGQRVLLRISNLSVTNHYTVRVLGLPMEVIGRGARQSRGPAAAGLVFAASNTAAYGNAGANLAYKTSHVSLAPGEGYDVIVDTTGATAGTYFLYTTNLNYLSNDTEDFGGMMTEIHLNP